MRIRSIKPEFWRDPDTTGRWPAELKLFYIGLWCVADDQGRFQWDEELIAADLYPFERDVDLIGLLKRLAKAGCVVAYTIDGRRYGYLPNFTKHQRINRPSPSRLPDPAKGLTEPSVSAHGGLTAGKELGAGSLEQGACESSEAETAPPREPPSPVVASLPCVGEGPKDYPVTQAQVDRWAGSHPGIDVGREVLKARDWLEANPGRRKTYRGCERFIVSWLARSQDAPRRNGASSNPTIGSAAPSPHSDFVGGVREL